MPRVNERPTAFPLADVVRYPKDTDPQQGPPDDERSSIDVPRSETRIATRPAIWAALSDEDWARDRIGAPVVEASPDEVRSLPLDPRAGFLLSLMDGSMDLETVVELSEMPRPVALHIVRDLFESGVVAFS